MQDYFEADFATSEADVAEEWLRANYGSYDIHDPALEYAERAAGDGGFALRRVHADSVFELTAQVDGVFAVTASAGYRWEIGDRRGEFSVSPALVQPGDHFRGRVDHVTMDIVAFDTSALERFARTVYGDDALRIRFDAPLPVSSHARDEWRATVRWALTQLPVLRNDLVRAAVMRAVAVATLSAFPLSGERRERAASAIEQAAIYRSARAFIDDHVSLPITIEDAASAVGTSTAGLRRAFAAHAPLDTSPDDYLRAARLSAAHADLVEGDADTDTVEEIALRWGFADPRAFRAGYRAEYAAAPEATLER